MITYVPRTWEGKPFTVKEKKALIGLCDSVEFFNRTNRIGLNTTLLRECVEKCLVYETVLNGMKFTGQNAHLTTRDKMRTMYCDALSALGFAECYLPGHNGPVVKTKAAIARMNRRRDQ